MKIIGISGRKQSGKNTVANYINGSVLSSKNMIQEFYIEDNGSLAIKTDDNTGNSAYGIFDVTRKDSTFIEYAEKELWPYIKVYHFADPLKEMAINLFGLNPTHVYGNDEDKNQVTDISWSDLPTNNKKTGYLTVREFLEYFGTKIVRKIRYEAWSEYTIKKVLNEKSEIAIIPDVRFPNEVETIKSAGGVVIRLTRDTFHSTAEAETALDENVYDWSKFDTVIDNKNISLVELCDKLNSIQQYWR